jgi:hypothetical protein
MGKLRVVTVKIPEQLYNEMILRIPKSKRSAFVREAIIERLQKIPKADKILELEQRLEKIENYLTNIVSLKHMGEKVNAYTFCRDELDQKIIEYLINYKGATTPELAEYTKTNRWLILNRLRKIQKASEKQHGKPIIEYYPGKRTGKKKAWWIKQELVGLQHKPY